MTRVNDETPPFVTVIMPVRNESAYIERALEAVLGQDYPIDLLQILIVDGHSDDDTRQRAQRLAAARNREITIVDNPGRIAPCALNAGLRAATGDLIVRVDGHCEIGPTYVAHGVAHLENPDHADVAGVGGVLDTVGETEAARAIAVAMSSRLGVGGSAFRTSEPDAPVQSVDTVAFPAYRRSTLEQAGPFDEELVRNQDDEYNYRLRKAGHRILLVPDMPVRYFSRATLGSLFRQYRQYGFWKVRVLQKHPRQMSWRQFAPPVLVTGLASSAAILCAMALGALPEPSILWTGLGIVLPLVYGGFLAIGAVRSGLARSVRIPTLAAALALMHLGYGIGFLAGLVRFAFRWGDPPDPTTQSQAEPR